MSKVFLTLSYGPLTYKAKINRILSDSKGCDIE